jgi:hypothetical protein
MRLVFSQTAEAPQGAEQERRSSLPEPDKDQQLASLPVLRTTVSDRRGAVVACR